MYRRIFLAACMVLFSVWHVASFDYDSYDYDCFFMRALASGMHISQTFHPQGLHMVKSRNWDGIAKRCPRMRFEP